MYLIHTFHSIELSAPRGAWPAGNAWFPRGVPIPFISRIGDSVKTQSHAACYRDDLHVDVAGMIAPSSHALKNRALRLVWLADDHELVSSLQHGFSTGNKGRGVEMHMFSWVLWDVVDVCALHADSSLAFVCVVMSNSSVPFPAAEVISIQQSL